jgi:PAS domain S-box-containing protein
MDAMRNLFQDFIGDEESLRTQRANATHAATRLTIVSGSGLALIVGLLLAFYTRRQLYSLSSSHERALSAEREQRELVRQERELLQVTLSSIGDAVIATDGEGKITFMNPIAEAVTGWTASEATGKALPEVFHIINEESRAEVESPVTKVLREGVVVGLANHTALIAKDGGEVPIADSGAPIRGVNGDIIGVVLVFRDITEHKRAEEEFNRLQRRSVRILESVTDAFVAINREWSFIYANPQSARILQKTPEELLGRNIWEVFPGAVESNIYNEFNRAMRDNVPVQFEEYYALQDFWAEIHVYPSKEGLSIYFQDISERKRQERQRAELLANAQRAQKLAEEANRFKDEFLATISHELRTPLTSIIGWIKMLRGDLVHEPLRSQALQTIERNADAQKQLIDDLMDVSRVITGKFRLEVRRVDLTSVIEAAIDTVRPAAEAKGVTLVQSLDPSVGPVAGDPDRLQQVVWNLLSNAIKFSDKASRVQVKLEPVESYIEITVIDEGQGIDPHFLPNVFDRFRQADSSITRQKGGLGLGLAIARHLVELHGGTIQASSDGEGHGATFTIKLPVMAVEPGKDGAGGGYPRLETGRNQGGLRPDLVGVRVLVVDDEPDTRVLLKVALAQYGAEVKSAASAPEGLALIQEFRPNVLIADIGMPGEDGYQFIKRVRALSETRGGRTPAAALTAYARLEDRLNALAQGFQVHIPKPINPDELALVVASLAER